MDIEERITCRHTLKVLHASGISTMEQLSAMSKDDLLKIRGVGKVIAADLASIMEQEEERHRGLPG